MTKKTNMHEHLQKYKKAPDSGSNPEGHGSYSFQIYTFQHSDALSNQSGLHACVKPKWNQKMALYWL